MNTLPTNRLRAKLESGTAQFGLWLGIPDTTVAEMMAAAGFDWLVVDHEHGPFELRDVMHHLQALAPYDVAPVVRPVNSDRALLKKLCDIGAQSFIVPMIDTAEQAEAVVRDVMYPPNGVRGLGTSMARAAKWNAIPEYVDGANDEMCIIVQAETATAIENLEAIAGTPGIDGVFFGPSDLSASMGYVGQVSHPDVVDAITQGIQTVRAAGKHAGLLCLNPVEIRDYVSAGANFVAVGLDTLVLGNAARSLAASFKPDTDAEPGEAGY